MSWKPWNAVDTYSEQRWVASYSLSDSSAGLHALWSAFPCVLAPRAHMLGISSEPVGLVFCSPVGRRNEVLEARLEHVFLASGNVSGSDFWQPYVICQRISKVPSCLWPQRKKLKDQDPSRFSFFPFYNDGFRIGSWWGWCRKLEQSMFSFCCIFEFVGFKFSAFLSICRNPKLLPAPSLACKTL